MGQNEPVHTTCPYCGVGCGVVVDKAHNVAGDVTHPANFGRLCSKGSALGETLAVETRLLYPAIGGKRASWDVALDTIAARFKSVIEEHGPDAVAFYVSGQCLTEDYYVANKLMKGFIGSGNIDTNSRLCMASSVAGHIRAFGADIVPCIYEDLEEADLVVLVGSNAAWCHPVLHQRLLAARAKRGTRVIAIDPRRTATCEDADLHLALAPGSDVALFNGLLTYLAGHNKLDQSWVAAHTEGFEAALEAVRTPLGKVAEVTGLNEAEITTFYSWFAETERTVTAYSQGVNQSSVGTDKVNAIINCHLATGRIGKPGSGPFSLTGQPNAMGGREVGGLANQLAAHMKFEPVAIDRVRRFWNAPNVATKPGLKAVSLFDAVLDGRIKAIWIMATNPADSMPRAGRIRKALEACPFVVASDCWPTDTTALAHIVLPAAAWGEKDGTVTNSERRISRQRRFQAPPGEAKPDWWMMAEVGRRLGFAEAFAFPSAAAVFREHAALSAFENNGERRFDLGALANIDDAAYDHMPPQRWPLRAHALAEGGRLFSEGGFQTPNGRARFIATLWRPLANTRDSQYPFLLNTGRIRDQWHTMTRTGLTPRLLAHTTEPQAAMSPIDLEHLHIPAEGGLVKVKSADGSCVLRAVPDTRQRPGEIFIPMHWTDTFSSAGPVDRLVNAAVDPFSGQPELKATPVTVQHVATRWRALLLHRRAVRPQFAGYWSSVPIAKGFAFELAGTEALASKPAEFFRAVCDYPDDAEILSVTDAGRGSWRFAALVNGRLDSCLFITTRAEAALPAREGLSGLINETIADEARPGLLAARTSKTAATGRTICACYSVGLLTLQRHILAHRYTSAAEIGLALSAGTNCGSCIPELNEILRDIHASAA